MWSKIILGSKKFGSQKNLGPKDFLDKKILINKNFDQQKFGQNIVGPKTFSVQKSYLSPNKFLSPNVMGKHIIYMKFWFPKSSVSKPAQILAGQLLPGQMSQTHWVI